MKTNELRTTAYDAETAPIDNDEVLKYLSKEFKTEDLLIGIKDMKMKEIIQQHPYRIFKSKDGRWRTYLLDETRPNGRRQVAKSTEAAVHKAIVEDYENRMDGKDLRNLNLENLYEKWMLWRRDIGTDAKTIKENANEWNKHLENSAIAKQKVRDIRVMDLEDFFFDITKGHAITFKRMTNIRSLLNGVFKFAVRHGIVSHSIVFEISYNQFRARCKPSKSNKEPYTEEERKKILAFLADKTDIYSMSIKLAFYLSLRIGELQVIKKTDVGADEIFIGRAMRRRQSMNDDLTFNAIEYVVEERIKGNQTEGFSKVALTPQA